MQGLKGLSVVVTGAGGAIGSEIVAALARRQARIVVASLPGDLGAGAAADKARELGAEACLAALDIQSPEQVAAVISKTVDEWGRIDVLINNAGRFQAIGALWEQDPEVWLADVTTNLFGTFLCCRAAVPPMLRAGRGTIINLVGGGFDIPNPGGTSYASSKAGVARLTDTLAAELSGAGLPIAVHAIMPGLVRSGMTEELASSQTGLRWLPHVAEGLRAHQDVTAAEVAEGVVRLAERAHEIPSGRVLNWDDDLDQIVRAADSIAAEDLFQIRWKRGTSPASTNPESEPRSP